MSLAALLCTRVRVVVQRECTAGVFCSFLFLISSTGTAGTIGLLPVEPAAVWGTSMDSMTRRKIQAGLCYAMGSSRNKQTAVATAKQETRRRKGWVRATYAERDEEPRVECLGACGAAWCCGACSEPDTRPWGPVYKTRPWVSYIKRDPWDKIAAAFVTSARLTALLDSSRPLHTTFGPLNVSMAVFARKKRGKRCRNRSPSKHDL